MSASHTWVTLPAGEALMGSTEFPDLAPEQRAPGSLVFTPTAGPVDLRHW